MENPNLTLKLRNNTQEKGLLKTLSLFSPIIIGATAYTIANSCELNAPLLGYVSFAISAIYIKETRLNP